MSKEYTKGGRGKKAPYATTHLRVPVPIKDRVQALIERFKETLDPNVDTEKKTR